MFRREKKPILDSIADSFLSWVVGLDNSFFGPDDWFNHRSASDRVVEEKQKEANLYLDGRLAKVRFEAYKTRQVFRLKATVLELDGQPILPEEQEKKAVEIWQVSIDEDDQCRLLGSVLANFGVGVGRKMAVVSDDFARGYARCLRMRNRLDQKA